MARVRDALPADVTLVANMVEHGKTPARTLAELGAAGYRMVAVPVAGLLAAARALEGLYATLQRDGTTRAYLDRLYRFDAMNALLGLDELYQREREWLG
jgi:2-methylisocitrate lyase-like PEP mutase family enzyme